MAPAAWRSSLKCSPTNATEPGRKSSAIATSAIGEDDLMELVLGAGADDMQNVGEVYEITCDPAAYEGLKKAIEAKNIPIQSAEISMVPQNVIPIPDVETARKILRLMDAFDDQDDVQNAHANFDIPEEIAAQASS